MERQESMMRGSIKLSGRATTVHGRAAQILASRGAFKWLPVVCSNDLVHGSWWFVWGSLGSAVIAVVPLIDLSSKIFHVSEETDLKAFDASATWVLLIISSVFFTVGSYVFVRAFESPPKPPLSNWKHFSTDELLAAWLYLFAMSPYIPYSMFYINVNRHRYVYWGAFFASCFFVAASAFFVYTCYPSHHHMLENVKPRTLLITIRLFGEKSWLCKHVLTDWLASTWFFFYATLLWFVGSWLLLFSAENDRQIFVWVTSTIDAFLFLIGSAYYVAGSYPPDDSDEQIDHDTQTAYSTKEYNNEDQGEAAEYDYGAEDDRQQAPQSPSSSSPTFRAWGSKAPSTAAVHSSSTDRGGGDYEMGSIPPSKDSTTFRAWGSKGTVGPLGDVPVPAPVSGTTPEGRFRVKNTRDFHQSEDQDSDTFNILHGR